MKRIEVSKHTKYTLELIFSEAQIMAEQVLSSISENRNKSIVLIAFIFSIASYSFVKILENNGEYFILLIGAIVAWFFLRENLMPSQISFRGAQPENMIHPYFDKFSGETLEKEYLATQIETYNKAINENASEMKEMPNRFKKSLISVLLSLLLFGVVFLFFFIESLPS